MNGAWVTKDLDERERLSRGIGRFGCGKNTGRLKVFRRPVFLSGNKKPLFPKSGYGWLAHFGGLAGAAVCGFAGIECALGCLEYGLTSAVLHNRLLSLLFNTYSESAVWRFIGFITRYIFINSFYLLFCCINAV